MDPQCAGRWAIVLSGGKPPLFWSHDRAAIDESSRDSPNLSGCAGGLACPAIRYARRPGRSCERTPTRALLSGLHGVVRSVIAGVQPEIAKHVALSAARVS